MPSTRSRATSNNSFLEATCMTAEAHDPGWPFSRFAKGYGSVWRDGRVMVAHRAAWEFINGPIPDGLLAMHLCDTPSCFFVEHLTLGTNRDNMADMTAKSRQASKLTADDVALIRERYTAGGISQIALAEEFGVRQSQISRAVNRVTWRHRA